MIGIIDKVELLSTEHCLTDYYWQGLKLSSALLNTIWKPSTDPGALRWFNTSTVSEKRLEVSTWVWMITE